MRTESAPRKGNRVLGKDKGSNPNQHLLRASEKPLVEFSEDGRLLSRAKVAMLLRAPEKLDGPYYQLNEIGRLGLSANVGANGPIIAWMKL